MRHRLVVAGVAASVLAWMVPLRAGVTTGSVGVSVTIAATAKLVLGRSTVSFANADPDTTPLVVASEGPITIVAKARTSSGSAVTLTVLAAADLVSGPNVIPINRVQWTASGIGFTDGALSRQTAQTVGAWTGPGEYTGAQSFALVNSWSYATGTYTATATYTLTAP